VVIITGFGDEPITNQAMSLDHLAIRKPFREKDIVEVLSLVMKSTKFNNNNQIGREFLKDNLGIKDKE
jgi:FixJ family two-component response regulator